MLKSQPNASLCWTLPNRNIPMDFVLEDGGFMGKVLASGVSCKWLFFQGFCCWFGWLYYYLKQHGHLLVRSHAVKPENNQGGSYGESTGSRLGRSGPISYPCLNSVCVQSMMVFNLSMPQFLLSQMGAMALSPAFVFLAWKRFEGRDRLSYLQPALGLVRTTNNKKPYPK